MRYRRVKLIVLGLAGILALCEARASPFDRETVPPPVMSTGDANADAVLKLLRPTLHSAAEVGRINFGALCRSDRVLFPKTAVQPPSTFETGVAAVQQMFRADNNVVVTETGPAIITISIGTVHDSILRTRIPAFRLTQVERFNVPSTFAALLNNGRVKTAMQTQGVRPEHDFDVYGLNPSLGELPHLPPVMYNVTVEQVIDRIAQTFKGIVLYGSCTNAPVFQMYFIPLVDSPPEIQKARTMQK